MVDTTAAIFLGAIILIFGAWAYLNRYGQRHWAGGGILKSDDTWVVASETVDRPFFYDVDTNVIYRLISILPITEIPTLKFMARLKPVKPSPAYDSRIIEVKFESGKNPPRPANAFTIMFNEPGLWFFSQVGPVSDSQMSQKQIEDLSRQLMEKDQELIQERAEREAKIKDMLHNMSMMQQSRDVTVERTRNS
jgi:hypothetical protein